MDKILMILVLIGSVGCGFEIVDDGYVGIKTTFGQVDKEEYKPGLHFYNPISSNIFEMEIREQSWADKTQGYSADNQIVAAEFKVNYKPKQNMMAELYTNQGDDYVNVILPQRVTSSIKEVLGKYKATTLVQVRNKFNDLVTQEIRLKLKDTSLLLVSFEITNFDYDDDFEAAVKAKIVAKERAVEEKNKTVQVKEQATQKVLTAKAEATSIKVMAEALSRNKDLIQLEAVKKWNGVLPVTTMGGAIPFINLKAKM